MNSSNKKQFKIFYEEIKTVIMRRGSVIISEDRYPEIAGLSDEEIIQYVKDNVDEMETDSDYYSIGEELQEAEINYQKFSDQGYEFIIEKM